MREALTSETAKAVGPYSHAIESEGLVFCSGQTPIDPASGQLAIGGVAAQTNQCFDNLFAVLAAGGLTPDDVIKVNVYLTHMSDFTPMNNAYEKRFSEPFPARTTVGVAGLPLGASVEIELIARRPESR
ncbi:MAG: RidA family protein [Acidimicrobiales bacterium]|nr:RidA family protein [Acidimicrobiales bacterium]RZV48393.1 MAG: RidA family protein [Acidimicrobiales bacterium]